MGKENPTPAEKRAQDAEEYRYGIMGLLGDVAKVGFWGALLAGIMAVGAYFILGSEKGKEWIGGDDGGLEGMLMADKVFSFLDDIFGEGKGLYNEDELEAAYLRDEDINTLIQAQLSGSEILIGENTLSAMLTKGDARAATLALLRQANPAFTFKEAEKLDMAMVQQAVQKLLSGNDGNPLMIRRLSADGKSLGDSEELSQEAMDKVAASLLQGLIKDLSEGTPEQRRGWIRYANDVLRGHGEVKDLAENADILATIAAKHPDEAIQLLGLTSDNPERRALTQDAAKRAEITDMLKNANPQQVQNLVKWLMADSDKLKEGSTDQFISNLDVIMELTSQPKASEALSKMVTIIMSDQSQEEKMAALKSLSIDEATYKQAFAALQDLDFGKSGVVDAMRESQDSKDQGIVSLVDLVKGYTSVNFVQAALLNSKLRSGGVKDDVLTIHGVVLDGVKSEDEKKDEIDMAINLIGGSFMKTHQSAR